MDLPTTHTKWTSCTGGSWIIITKYLKRHANAKRLQENIGWVGLIFLSGILSGGSLETMHLGHWDWHEMKQCKNPCSENESKQLPSMLLFPQAHPIPSQSWWASHSCTLLYLTLLYLILLYLTYSTWLYSTWLYSTWFYSTWLYSTWPTLLDTTLLDSTLLDTTLLDTTLLDLTLLRCRSYIGSFWAKLPLNIDWPLTETN